MPSPSPLAVASSSVVRLLKEEVSYRMELVEQEARVQALEKELARGQGQSSEDGNEEFMLKQQRTATEQTRAIFGPLRERIAIAITRLEEQIATGEASGAEAVDLDQAKAVLAQAKAAQNGAS